MKPTTRWSPIRSTSATGRSARSSARRSTWPRSTAATSIPLDLDEYLRHDGFVALRRCLNEYDPPSDRREVRRSGLRGRGGAGFPTGIKWAKVARAAGETKYVICNGDEGDPGAFMDRMLLESFPLSHHRGHGHRRPGGRAHEAIFYIRAEYPLAVERIREALERCREARPAGRSCAGQRFAREFRLRKGPGRSSAAKRRRCWPRSKAVAACRGCGRRIRPNADCGSSRRWSTTWRPMRCCRGSFATGATSSRGWARLRAKARRSSPWPARSAAAG